MNRFARATLAASALSLGLMLAGCESWDQFDPTDLFSSDIFVTKKKLPGERQPVFPEGTPGVPQGVPAELVKGHNQQAVAEPETTQAIPEKQAVAEPEKKPKAKPKAKPKVVAKPAEPSTPTSVTVRRAESPWSDPPQQQQQQQPQQQQQQEQPAAGWPGSQRGMWPDPPR